MRSVDTPKCWAANVLSELRMMYQLPSCGLNTDMSVLPSPSKSTYFAFAVVAASPKMVNRAAGVTANPFAAPASWMYHRAKKVFPTNDGSFGIAKLTDDHPLPTFS